MPICVHEQSDTDFATNGLGVITPSECAVHWTENGEYALEIEHPIDQLGKYERLCAYGRVVVAPVPVRESPLYEFTEDIIEGEDVKITRNVWTVSGTTVGLYMRSGPGTNHKKYGYLKNGAKVTEIGRQTVSGRVWVHVIVQKGGRNCWMSTKWLKKTGTVTEIVQEAKVVGQRTITREQHRDQPFDIYAWEPDVDRVTAKARHVFWRLAGNLVCNLEIKNKTARQAMDALFAAAEYQDHGFEWHCDATPAMSLENPIEGKNLVDAILGEGGICDTYGLKLMVDWYDIYLLKDSGANRGVQIRYGKNLLGMTGGFDTSKVVTRVLPVGQTKEGKPLYMSGTKYLESPHAALYREPIYGYLKVNDAKVGSKPEGSDKQLTAAQARARLKAAAQAELDAGCDLPECSLNVEMAQLRRDPAYSEYADLEIICPGDTLGLFVPNFGLALNVRLTEYEYDALSGQYAELTIGSPSRNMSNSGITSRQLGGASVTASKLAANAVGASAIQDDVVSARHMQAESVNTEALQAESVTAEKVAAHSMTADKFKAGEIETESLKAFQSYLENVTAGSIETDELAAQLARVQVLIAGAAQFDKATIQHLVAEAMHLSFGEAAQVYIDNLMVNYAQMVSAAIGDLVVKASDGNYYHLDVAQDGSVTATKTTVTEGEINAGQTGDGKVILETDITASNLSTSNLFATFALVNRIDAARIDVDELFAREAFITLLRTSHIVGEKSLEIVVRDTEAAQKAAEEAIKSVDVEYYLSDSPTELSGGSWSADAPEWAEGKYIWSRTVTTSNAGAVNTSEPSCITGNTGATGPAGADGATGPAGKDGAPGQDGAPGANGKDGAAGVGVSAIVEEYYLSTSRTEQTGGGWSTSQPAWQEGRYLWTRSRITWTDGNATTTSPVLAEAINSANNMQIGGTQILRGTNTVRTLTSDGNWSDTHWRAASGGVGKRESIDVTDAPNANIRVGWRLTRESSALDIAQDSVPVQAGETYTMSCYARGTGGLNLQYGKGGYANKVIQLSNVTKWTRYSLTFVVGAKDDGSTDGSTNIYYGNRDGASTIEICGMKLEHGDRATDWTPSPDDVDAQIDSTTELLSGQIEDVSDRVNDCVTHTEQAVYLRQMAGKGVYVGFEGGSAEAFIDASGWFRVLHNGQSITSLGPRIQELGTLTIYETADGGHAFI